MQVELHFFTKMIHDIFVPSIKLDCAPVDLNLGSKVVILSYSRYLQTYLRITARRSLSPLDIFSSIFTTVRI